MRQFEDDEPVYWMMFCRWCDEPQGHHLYFCKNGEGIRWKRLRDHVLARDNFTCRYCNGRLKQELIDAGDFSCLHVDHVRPRSKGGRDVPWNLVTACRTCNSSKRNRIPDWLGDWEKARADKEAAAEDALWAACGAYD